MFQRTAVPLSILVSLVAIGSAPLCARQAPRWAEGFDGGAFTTVRTLVVPGTGATAELQAFGEKGGSPMGARFDGVSWRRLPDPSFEIRAATTFGPGSGQVVGTTGTMPVLRLANGAWSTVGTVFQPGQPPFPNVGTTGPILTWDDGTGPAVYMGGRFISVNGTGIANLARWNGSTWSAVGGGVDGTVEAMTVFDDGGGPALYVAGSFMNAGGTSADHVARWRNGAWTALPGLNGSFAALQAFDDGSGPQLYAGGNVLLGTTLSRLVRWNGTNWIHVGAPAAVTALEVHDDGGGPALFATTGFPSGLRRLRNGTWTTLPLPPASNVDTLRSFQGRLWIGGTFEWAGPQGTSNIQSWDGTRFWNAFTGLGTNGAVNAGRVVDFGSGPRLVVAGDFERAGRTPAHNIASFDGTTWSSLGTGVGDFVTTMGAFPPGPSARLIVGGGFTSPGACIASFDGASWSPLGTGMTGSWPYVFALETFDDGGGTSLFAGGRFDTAGGTIAPNVARWNGTAWSALGNGFTDQVMDFQVHDDGGGARLYAGGFFTHSGATLTRHVALWNGTSWQPVGAGVGQEGFGVFTLCVFDDGTGPKLVAGGDFDDPYGNVARFDGVSWTVVGNGLPRRVTSLAVHDDGSGQRLYAGIERASPSPIPSLLFRLEGATWVPVLGAAGTQTSEFVNALATYDDPSSDPPALYVLGQFQGVETLSSNVAKLSRSTEDVLLCLGDGSGAACPCGNASTSAQAGGCLNSLGQAGTLRTSGSASTTSDSLVLLGSSMSTSGTALYFQGTTAIGFGTGIAFGDGLRCAGGSILRLATVTNSAGASQVPSASHPTPLSVAGSIPPGGGTRVYQVWYRNFGPCGTGSNLTNGAGIVWAP